MGRVASLCAATGGPRRGMAGLDRLRHGVYAAQTTGSVFRPAAVPRGGCRRSGTRARGRGFVCGLPTRHAGTSPQPAAAAHLHRARAHTHVHFAHPPAYASAPAARRVADRPAPQSRCSWKWPWHTKALASMAARLSPIQSAYPPGFNRHWRRAAFRTRTPSTTSTPAARANGPSALATAHGRLQSIPRAPRRSRAARHRRPAGPGQTTAQETAPWCLAWATGNRQAAKYPQIAAR